MCSRPVTEVSNNLDEITFISKGAQCPACADASALLTVPNVASKQNKSWLTKKK